MGRHADRPRHVAILFAAFEIWQRRHAPVCAGTRDTRIPHVLVAGVVSRIEEVIALQKCANRDRMPDDELSVFATYGAPSLPSATRLLLFRQEITEGGTAKTRRLNAMRP